MKGVLVNMSQFYTVTQLHDINTMLYRKANKTLFSHSILQVSLVLEPLPELYDSSSVPAPSAQPDMAAAAAQGSSKPRFLAPSQQSKQTRVTVVDREPVNNRRATSPRYLLEKFLVYFAVRTLF